MTAPRTPVEALAEALHDGTPHHWRGGVDDSISRRACTQFGWEGSDCMRKAPGIIAHLPEGWSLIDAPTLAERLHEGCRAEWASMSARDRAVVTQHGPDAHLGEARGLLGGGGS
jgi:hypothetical protein